MLLLLSNASKCFSMADCNISNSMSSYELCKNPERVIVVPLDLSPSTASILSIVNSGTAFLRVVKNFLVYVKTVVVI